MYNKIFEEIFEGAGIVERGRGGSLVSYSLDYFLLFMGALLVLASGNLSWYLQISSLGLDIFTSVFFNFKILDSRRFSKISHIVLLELEIMQF